jgi:hypothetical protein
MAKGSTFSKVIQANPPPYFFIINTSDVRAFIAPVIRYAHTHVWVFLSFLCFALLISLLGLYLNVS